MTRGVKLLLVESGQSVGGTERVVWELATRLRPERFRVRVWLSPASGVTPFAAALERRQVSVRRVNEVDSRWDWGGMLATWRVLRQESPTVLHIHHVWPAADRYLAALAGLAGVPHVVVTEHIVGTPHSAGQTGLKRRELGRADAVTAVSGAVADALVRDYGLARARIRIVPPGADPPDPAREAPLAREARAALGAGVLRPLVVCVGRLERQKGHDVLLEAVAALRARGVDCVVARAGGGAERAPLEQRARALKLDGRVRFLGALDDPAPLIAAANVVVLPSRWEGLPLVLLEAMMRGRAVVASAVGGIPEVLEDGVNGRLVPPENPAALAAALEPLLRKPDVALALGSVAARDVADRFTWARVVQQYEAVYDEVLGLASFAPDDAAPARGRR
jgi:glycosyltransferase involved in cell wall biosynthesis